MSGSPGGVSRWNEAQGPGLSEGHHSADIPMGSALDEMDDPPFPILGESPAPQPQVQQFLSYSFPIVINVDHPAASEFGFFRSEACGFHC